MRPLVEQGDALAQFNLAVMYAEGQGVPQDYQETARWLRMAAEQGDRSAQVPSGVMYAKGRGGLQGEEKAIKVHGVLEKYMREILPSKT